MSGLKRRAALPHHKFRRVSLPPPPPDAFTPVIRLFILTTVTIAKKWRTKRVKLQFLNTQHQDETGANF